jgi:hypothetical protein
MNVIFMAGVKYTREMEDGVLKRTTDFFIVPAVSFTDAEAKITEEMATRTKQLFVISSIKRTKYSYVLTNDEGGAFYNVTVAYAVEEEKSTKKIKINMLVETSDIANVNDIVKNVMSGTVSEYEVLKVSLSPVLHVIEETQDELAQ